MEIRKIQRTGGSTYIVSLPKQWADHVGLTSGMNVGITTRPDGSLLISPDIPSPSPSPTKKQLDVTDRTGDVLVREIIASYIAGFNVIELVSKRITAEQKQTIRQITHKLIGPEIVEETADRMIIQDLLNPVELSLRQSVRRMYLIASSMQTDAIHALASSDSDLAMDVSSRDDEVDRLYLLIEKQLRIMLRSGQVIDSQKDMTPDMSLDLSLAAQPIEKIADHARKIALITISLKKQLPEDVVRMFKGAGQSVSKLVENSVESLFSSDIDKANNSIEMKMEINKALHAIDKKLVTMDPRDALHLRIVSDSIDRIGDYGANIAEIAINSTISKSL
ncbi:MAG: phosphate uptake regulator PhoU [ANME-2 cluster archaeon]|nr:phosphate uptake regulator PhoU [ANME-2 cluster archaeon]MBC2700654.1 phosphate uptake regulator PhoU [ANME-2 cluster archaeon]MBC2706215.1 phosphate uptake regulator PhoU [ANME-2 cluster archaeon]MBC2746728.1 phosphate uptake regulator PhoU [ANME-2 cluster archaeon]MBC2762351.1 phosphate uptake regulator PhoU [ANME-2 cluster archaeon]